MLQRAQKLIVVSLLVTLIGGHWAILQGVAWAQMFVRYSHDATWERALTSTFGGKRPCRLCKLVREGRAKERKQEMLKIEAKLEFTFVASAALPLPPRPHRQLIANDEIAQARLVEPPTPPPRSV